MRALQLVLAIAAVLVGLESIVAGWWIGSSTGRRVEHLFATIHVWIGLILVAGAIVALLRPKAVPVTLLAAGLMISLMSFSIWKNARAVFGDGAYSRAKDGNDRIPLE